ncbi:uncharacterized protein HD556DRAFT_1446498 [Suillus plorans]|uniref:Uncharacterized protein n=1 Tax=Suillus plorans TaxID=116603 RepID=A0A9P7AHX3_9AGAM|nr:uncharacterized protein HD556DRAFT_1446498 [Suillus plorans]KAG1789922.1 hypothetical protein HD556DRAFT_1446498 [Suillus plorans]
MSSKGPTREALNRIINQGHAGLSQRERRERRPSERALYQAEEEQVREVRRQPKSNSSRKKSDLARDDGTQFTTEDINLFSAPAVDGSLKARFSKIPPREKRSENFGHRTVHLKGLGSKYRGLLEDHNRQRPSHGWQEDGLSKESGFINKTTTNARRSQLQAPVKRDQWQVPVNSPKSPLHRLTAGRVQELVELRHARSSLNNTLDEKDNGDEDQNAYDDEALADGHENDTQVFVSHDNEAADDDEVECLSDNKYSLKHSRSTSLEESDGTRYHKRARHDDQPSPHQRDQRLPRKVRDSKGRVAAHDYEDAVQ